MVLGISLHIETQKESALRAQEGGKRTFSSKSGHSAWHVLRTNSGSPACVHGTLSSTSTHCLHNKQHTQNKKRAKIMSLGGIELATGEVLRTRSRSSRT